MTFPFAIFSCMNENKPVLRSPERMIPTDTGLLVVDVQDKLIRLVPGYERIVWNIRRLLDGAALFKMSIQATEQYPQGLGGTTATLTDRLGTILPKVAFSCGDCSGVLSGWSERGIDKLLVCGFESHVCIQQTVLDALANGFFRVYVAVDAIGARGEIDHKIALRRMEASGATLTTTEAALFEWCQTAGTPEFKQISALIRETGP